jgi:uncharacterized protein YxeA
MKKLIILILGVILLTGCTFDGGEVDKTEDTGTNSVIENKVEEAKTEEEKTEIIESVDPVSENDDLESIEKELEETLILDEDLTDVE